MNKITVFRERISSILLNNIQDPDQNSPYLGLDDEGIIVYEDEYYSFPHVDFHVDLGEQIAAIRSAVYEWIKENGFEEY
jgi:hypothetical protein